MLEISENKKLEELISILKEENQFQMSDPTLTSFIKNKKKTLFLKNIKQTHSNLNLKLGKLV